MSNIAILYCKRIKDHSCVACAKCFKGIKEKNGEFARHDDIDLVAMTDCGDCPGLTLPRVKLLSDVSTEMKARIGRFHDGEFVLVDGYFWLTGRGRGLMEIRDADRRDVDAGKIKVGDVVLSDPTSDAVPTAMTIGRIVEITPDRDRPLFCILAVASEVATEALQRVYVYDPEIVTEEDAD